MVSISLRSYINEINDMVDQRQIDESIAHCRHILETYPKHVDTYRLLGKAYLEEQRYSDASDILQRVLSSVPEDFIAQVGMSIIREDEGNLDSAIYHMERAFETQPSNHAIQSELRRLNTQRDGIEMKRVRLTRGALARMYAHGNLYEQAISELHAALAEEPNRYDLQSLLAEMYYQTDKKVDAAETCTKILEKLPHCINANRLLTIILEESGRPEEAQRFRQRWSALDPYAAFVGTEYPTVEQVPDNKVSIEHFEWDPSEMYTREGGQPGWAASLGVSISEEERGELPDWLNGEITSPEEQMQELDDEFPTGDHRPTEMLPDEIASGESQEEDIGRMEGGRIDLMPQDTGEDEEDDWLSEFEDKGPEIEDEDEDDWLASLEEQEEEAPAPSGFDPFAEPKSENEEDWLGILDKPEAEPAAEEDLFEAPVSDQEEDEWLSSLGAAAEQTEAGDSDPFAEPAEVDEEDDGGDEEPDWLSSLGPAAEQPPSEKEDELPDFLKEAGWEAGSGEFDESTPVDFEEDEDQPLEQAEIPDWIKDMAPPEDAFEEEDLEAEADPEWLKSLETPSSTEKPEWLSEMEAQPDVEPAPEAETPLSEPLQPETPVAPAAGTEIEPDEMDLAWLENLAAKRGIPDEELVTSAEQRASLTEEDRPAPEDPEEAVISAPAEEPTADTDWLQQIGQQQEEAEEDQAEAEQESEEEPGEDTATWLSSIADDREVSPIPGVGDDTISRFLAAKDVLEPDEEPARIPSEETTDDWFAELGEDDEEVELPDAGPISEEEDDIDTDWLRQIGQQAAQEAAESEEQPEEETPSPVDEEADDFDMDWLSEIGAQAAEEAAAGEAPPELPEEEVPEEEKWLAPPTQSAPLPLDAEPEDYDDDWLTEVGEEVIEKAAAPEPPGDPESDWLHAPPTDLTQADEPQITPIDEDADDIDSDWLTQIGEEALEEASEETISPGEITEEEIDEEDWLSGLASDQAEEEPSADILPMDRAEGDDLTMKWIEEVSEEAAQETAEEAAEEESIIEPIEEIADEYDMDWLKEFAEEEAEEAGPPQPVAGLPDDDELDEWLDDATQPSAAASEQAAEDLDLDWLDELGAEEGEETAPEPTQPSAAAPVDEEADDFDMDWLTQIGEEAAEEAAQEPEEEGLPDASQSTAIPVDAEPKDYADDWLTEAGEDVIEQAAAPEPTGEEEDWLSGPPTEPTPAPPPDLTPVDEEADDFDMDWLTQIGEEAIQEAAEEDLSPGELTEEGREEDQAAEPTQPSAAAPVDEEADDFDMDWLESIGKEAAEEAAEEDQEDWLAETTQSEPAAPVDEEADDFNTAWLEEIGAEAAQEAAGSEQQPEETPEEAQPTSTDDWLTQLEEEDEGSLERAISDTDAWLLSMEDTVPTGDQPAPEETEDTEPEIEDTGDWLASLGVEQDEEEAAEESDFEEQFDLEPESEQEHPAEEALEFEPEPPAAEVQPAESEDWQPEVEAEAEAQVEPNLPPLTPPEEVVDDLFETAEPEPVEEAPPAAPQAETPEDQLDDARQAVSDGNIDKALASYGKLIKKGKLVDQIIKDLNDATMRHPINVKLWQTLGDAYLRLDNLQDALDAYSKAEDLIR